MKRDRAWWARTALLASVFVCAACGLIYELALVTLGSYLLGNTAEQASIVLSVMVCAMGVGALGAKKLQKHATISFIVIELLLAVVGGLSVLVLYAAFAWLHLYTFALVIVAFLVGALIGAEIPLLMGLLQRIRKQSAEGAVADLSAADYIGALLGGLTFPFFLLPVFGQIRGAILVGVVNVIAGVAVVLVLFRDDLRQRMQLMLGSTAIAVVAILAGGYLYSTQFEASAQQAMYEDPIIYSEQTQYQKIVLTEDISLDGESDLRLYLNGDLQFSSRDEYRYHEALVHPALAGARKNVLILGGGDGLALREVLRYEDVQSVTLVELDAAVTKLARQHEKIAALNRDALDDSRVRVVNKDAFQWLQKNSDVFDAIIVDMPDPDETATAKLYSVEFYRLVSQHLNSGAVMSVQSGSPYYAPRSFGCINASLRAAGLQSTPYQVHIPSFGPWGFHLVGREDAPRLTLDAPGQLRSLDRHSVKAAGVFSPDQKPRQMPPSTLMKPVILQYALQEWKT